MVDLVAVDAPARVPATIATALAERLPGIEEAVAARGLGALCEALRDCLLLLVLDNFEHLLPAAQSLAILLSHCPQVHALITSRETLHLRMEHVYQLEPLPVPDLQNLPAVDALVALPSVALFVREARRQQHDFALSPQNASAVAELCVRLDGLPLAIELAAAWVRIFPPATLLDQLHRVLPTSAWPAYDAPNHHRTLDTAIEWSVSRLSEAERHLFYALGVFRGGWSLEAAQAVAGIDDSMQALLLLRLLVDKHLVQSTVDTAHATRFSMLVTVRDYAVRALAQDGRLDEVQRRHARYFAQLCEELEPQLRGTEQLRALDLLGQETANWQRALQWANEQQGADDAVGLRIATGLHRFWFVRGHYQEGKRLALAALNAAPNAPAALRAQCLTGVAFLDYLLGDFEHAVDCAQQAGYLARTADDRLLEASAIMRQGLATVRLPQSTPEQALALLRHALALFEELDHDSELAVCLNNLGTIAMEQGLYSETQRCLERGIPLAREIRYQSLLAVMLINLGSSLISQDAAGAAVAPLEEALVLEREIGNVPGELHALITLVFAHCEQHQSGEALRLIQQILDRLWQQEEARNSAACLYILVLVLLDLNRHELAARIYGAAEAMAPAHLEFVSPYVSQRVAQSPARLEQALGRAEFEAARQAGSAQALAALIDEILRLTPDELQSQYEGPTPSPLTAREAEILQLVAEGQASKEIARHLVISTSTVNRHLANIYAKLEVNSRMEAVHRARETNLLPA